MSKQAISRDIALRIALAARALPDTDATRLLNVLADAVGLPPTRDSLAGLGIKALKRARDGELAGIDNDSLKQALSILKGEVEINTGELPAVQAYREGDMPGSVRIACASNTGEELDGHFGSCHRFLVYQVDAGEARLIDIRSPKDAGDDIDPDADKNVVRASIIDDCAVLYVASIGGPAAAKVVKAGVHPMKIPNGGSIRDLLAQLQEVLASSPPPWLAKAMGLAESERVRFDTTSEELS